MSVASAGLHRSDDQRCLGNQRQEDADGTHGGEAGVGAGSGGGCRIVHCLCLPSSIAREAGNRAFIGPCTPGHVSAITYSTQLQKKLQNIAAEQSCSSC